MKSSFMYATTLCVTLLGLGSSVQVYGKEKGKLDGQMRGIQKVIVQEQVGDYGQLIGKITDGVSLNAFDASGKLNAKMRYPKFDSEALATKIGKIKPVDEWSLLHLAARDDNRRIVKALLEGGCDLNELTLKDKMTPLMIAAQQGHEKFVSILLKKGADRTLKNAAGKTALDLASEGKFEATVKVLEKAAEPKSEKVKKAGKKKGAEIAGKKVVSMAKDATRSTGIKETTGDVE